MNFEINDKKLTECLDWAISQGRLLDFVKLVMIYQHEVPTASPEMILWYARWDTEH